VAGGRRGHDGRWFVASSSQSLADVRQTQVVPVDGSGGGRGEGPERRRGQGPQAVMASMLADRRVAAFGSLVGFGSVRPGRQ
jgi:hypothetical protein